MSTAAEPHASVAPLAYRERAPSSELSHVVLSFWELRVAPELQAPYLHRVFPDGCLGLVYRRCGADSALLVRPPRLTPHDVNARPGTCYWGLRISPPSAAAFFGCSPAKASVSPDAGSALLPQLAAADGFEAAVEAFSSFARSRNVSPQAIDARIVRAVERIECAQGQCKIAELARELRMSERQLQRCFRGATGLTPKQYARTRRLRAIAVELAQASGRSTWVQRAVARGFADQAHLSRELHAMTGRAPVPFAGAIDEIDHGELIE